ncbi:hypothetical protein ABZ726_27120, partial [Streptomyces hundungensis]|uniref:hypothetical protein n=1 Tax=Streptomyces hundungensis TaxID=1077946 RepID=UPI0033F466A2
MAPDARVAQGMPADAPVAADRVKGGVEARPEIVAEAPARHSWARRAAPISGSWKRPSAPPSSS